jgi:hypothetical protein
MPIRAVEPWKKNCRICWALTLGFSPSQDVSPSHDDVHIKLPPSGILTLVSRCSSTHLRQRVGWQVRCLLIIIRTKLKC